MRLSIHRAMFEQRSLKLDLAALGLLALGIFLGASLLSYDAADPPGKLVYPARAETLNVCGRSGALVSTFLFNALGVGAYYLLFSLAVADAVLLIRRTISQPLLITGTEIALIYLIISLPLYKFAFDRARRTGYLVKLT